MSMKMNWGVFFDLINPDNTMSFNRLFAHAIGANETIIYFSLISKCRYWDSRDMLIDGEWFYSTIDDLQESTTFGRKQQDAAIAKLSRIGLIKYERKGIPAKRCFALVYDPELMCSILEEGKKKAESLHKKNAENKKNDHVNNLFTAQLENSVEPSLSKRDKQECLNNLFTTEQENSVESSLSKRDKQGCPKGTNKDVQKGQTINNLNKNNLNKINLSNQSISEQAEKNCEKIDRIDMDKLNGYRSLICSNIEYDELIAQNEADKPKIDEILENMLEMMCCTADTMRIGGSDQPTSLVQSRVMKIDSSCIEYILLCMRRNTTKVRNIKAYLRTVIFNAPSTMDSFFDSEVNNALYGQA